MAKEGDKTAVKVRLFVAIIFFLSVAANIFTFGYLFGGGDKRLFPTPHMDRALHQAFDFQSFALRLGPSERVAFKAFVQPHRRELRRLYLKRLEAVRRVKIVLQQETVSPDKVTEAFTVYRQQDGKLRDITTNIIEAYLRSVTPAERRRLAAGLFPERRRGFEAPSHHAPQQRAPKEGETRHMPKDAEEDLKEGPRHP